MYISSRTSWFQYYATSGLGVIKQTLNFTIQQALGLPTGTSHYASGFAKCSFHYA